jgi:hypothetical protein
MANSLISSDVEMPKQALPIVMQTPKQHYSAHKVKP